jgi:CRISPR-associated protein (TIGR03986 family)
MSNKYCHKTAGNFRAAAPYNFVPLPESVFIVSDEEKKDGVNDKFYENRHTGYIVLKIKTETPLYTRCAIPSNILENPKNFDEDGKVKITAIKECQDFFHRGQKDGDNFIPVISGSSLRGMTRSLVEILSYSKMLSFTDKVLVHRAVGESTKHGKTYRERVSSNKVNAGYLLKKGNEYYINPAKKNSKGESFVRVNLICGFNKTFEGYISSTGYNSFGRSIHTFSKTETVTETEKVTIVNSGEITLKQDAKRKSFAVYGKDATKELKIPQKLWDLYEEDHKKSTLQSPDTRKIENGEPLFYIQDSNGNVEYFGSTMMFRLPYNPDNCEPHKISDFIPNNLKQDNNDNLDLAETIFGFVRQNSTSLRAGRVFFTDAVWKKQSDDEYPFFKRPSEPNDDGRRIPKILASPKPNSFQLYLNQPDTQTKSVPQENGPPKTVQDGNSIKSYYDKDETLIRGTKLYWSKKSLSNAQEDFVDSNAKIVNVDDTYFRVDSFKEDDSENEFHKGKKGKWNEDSSQHTIIRPVQSETHFKGKVYFENLTKLELGALLTALELPDSKRHRFGMGKPLGLGTIKIETEVVLEQKNLSEENKGTSYYESLFDDKGNWSNPQKPDSRTIADECKNYFRQEILNHHNQSVIKPKIDDIENSSLENIPRLKAFFDILGWENDEVKNELNIRYLHPENDSKILRERHVLPTPKSVLENNNFAFFVEVKESNNSEKKNENEADNQNKKKSEPQLNFEVVKPTVPSTLVNLPIKNVPAELNKYYQDWKLVTDESLKLAMAEVIVEKGNTWRNAKNKGWFQEVVEFVEQNI